MPIVEVGGPIRGRRWVSLPFTDLCPPLVSDACLDSFAADDRPGAKRRGRRFPRGARKAPRRATHRAAGAVARPSAHSGSRAGRSVLSRLRPAQHSHRREGPRGCPPSLVRIGRGRGVYGLHVNSRRRLGLPVQPRRFFRLLWSRMIQPDLGRVLLVDVGTDTVAGAVFLTWNRTVVYKYGASDPRYWAVRPNNLLFWGGDQVGVRKRVREAELRQNRPRLTLAR